MNTKQNLTHYVRLFFTVLWHKKTLGYTVLVLCCCIVLFTFTATAYTRQSLAISSSNTRITALKKQLLYTKHEAAAIGSQSRTINNKIHVLKQSAQKNNLPAVTAIPLPTLGQTISLARGKVSFQIPSGWVVATASRLASLCDIGIQPSAAQCLDSTVIIPSALNSNSSTSSYTGITISVYTIHGYSTAQDWFTNCFSGTPMSVDSTSNTSMNGYSTYYINTGKEKLANTSQQNNEYYVLVEGSVAVVVTSNVDNNIGPNPSTIQLNNNSEYEPTVKLVTQSIRIQGL